MYMYIEVNRLKYISIQIRSTIWSYRDIRWWYEIILLDKKLGIS